MTAPITAAMEATATASGSAQQVQQQKQSAKAYSASSWRRGNMALLLALCLAMAALVACLPVGAEARAFAPLSEFEEGPGAMSAAQTAWRPSLANGKPLEAVGEEDGTLRTLEKRRLVVRVPFAQNPDGHQLSRIYKSLFEPSNSRAKKQPWAYSLRHFVNADEE